MSEVFKVKNLPYNLRRKTIFESRNVRTEHYGIESLTNLGPKIWSQVPDDIKHSGSLEIFKKKIRQWKPFSCPCRLCKTYVANLGYVSVC